MKKNLFSSLVLALTVATFAPVFIESSVYGQSQKSSISDSFVSGVVLDSITHEGEPMATLRVWSSETSQGQSLLTEKPNFEVLDNTQTAVMGTTDIDGHFSLSIKNTGDYVLLVTSIGRNPIVRSFSYNKLQRNLDLGIMLISEAQNSLSDVTIVTKAPIVKMEGDKISYSVKDDPDAKTNTVLEMLRKVPMVTVDGDDNIQVNGSSSFQIFMNGKPSTMLSGNPSQTLKAIPAESIKHIEVLTNPGAKYDAEGVGGILNIVTDVQQGVEGYTGNVSIQGGNRMNGGNTYVMIQKDKLTLSVNAHEGYMITPSVNSSTVREQTADNQIMESYTTMNGGSNILFSTIDAQYQIDDNNVVSASVNVMDTRGDNKSDATTSFSQPDSQMSSCYNQHNDNKSNSTSINGSIDYVHTFNGDPEHTLTAAYRVSTSPKKNISTTDYSLETLPSYDKTDRNNLVENTVQLDYTLLVGEYSTFETGGKYVWRNASSTSDLLDYENKSSIGALYTTYALSYGNFSLKSGLRYEHTSQDVTYNKGNGEDFSLTYDNLVPNITLSVSPAMGQNLSLGYNMRISRPGISVLNPYRNTQDLTSVSFGNPNLDVEKVNNVQLTYNYYSMKLMLNATLRYSYQNNGIEQYSYFDNNVLYTTYDNIGQRQNTSLSLFASWTATPSTRLTLNSTTTYVDTRATGLGYKNNGWQQTLMANIQQNLPYDFKLSAMYMINTPSISLQGSSSGMNMHMIGLTKSCLNDRLNFGINAINPFHSEMKMTNNSTGNGYKMETTTKVKMFTCVATVSYRFGNLKMKQKTSRSSSIDSDLYEVKGQTEQITGAFM